jgi:hypothetical protein
MDNIIEKVAAGLRNMKKKPDAFLFCDGQEDWTWDQIDICGIPVFHTGAMIDAKWSTSIEDVLFIPIWNKEDDYTRDRKLFIEGYNDWVSPEKRIELANKEHALGI